MRHLLYIFLLLLVPVTVIGQVKGMAIDRQKDSVLVLSGKVLSKGHPVPYATLQLKGTSVGVSCNDAGEFRFKIPTNCEQDTVIIRSLGYIGQKNTVRNLMKNGVVNLIAKTIELKTVEVSDFRSSRQLLLAVVNRIAHNYHQQTAWSTFFYRDWRAVDGELYLFDEAVMNVKRCPYSQYADKRSYLLDPLHREMESNLKTVLRHRLLVCDRKLLETKIIKSRGCDQMLVYSDNEDFFDPVATPQASYALASRILKLHNFEPIKVFSDDDEMYYYICSEGPCRTAKASVRYEYTIRKSDLALVRLVTSKKPLHLRAPNDAWVNWYYNSMSIESDSSIWTYDVRDDRYTLTRYYNIKSFRLESHGNGRDGMMQRWSQCHDWILTDFSLQQQNVDKNQIAVFPQVISGAFGNSDYDSDFWGHYNAIPIDLLPLQLLKNKFHLP